jgi:hypothetical protein
MFQRLSLKDTPKFTQIDIFGLKNTPSGNPAMAEAEAYKC